MLSWGKSHPEICSPREGKSPKCIRLCSFTTPTYGLHNACMTAVINDSPLAHFTLLFINICQVSQLFVEKKSVSCFCSLCYMTVFLLFSTTGVTPVRKQWHVLALVSVLQHHPCDIIIGTYFLGLNQLNKMFLKDCMDQSQLLFSWDMGHLQSGSWLKPPSIILQTEKSLSADISQWGDIQRCILCSLLLLIVGQASQKYPTLPQWVKEPSFFLSCKNCRRIVF